MGRQPILPCPCSGAEWKMLHKTIHKPIRPYPSLASGDSQCEYTITQRRQSDVHSAALPPSSRHGELFTDQ